MNKLSLILGGIALGAVGYGLKKWYDQTKEENAYWTDDPIDIICKMGDDATNKLCESADWLERKLLDEEKLLPADIDEEEERLFLADIKEDSSQEEQMAQNEQIAQQDSSQTLQLART